MANSLVTQARTRTFIAVGTAGCGRDYEYYPGAVNSDGLSKSAGAITKIKQPDPDVLGEYETVERVRGEAEDWTLGFAANLPATVEGPIGKMFKRSCPSDIIIAIGRCQTGDPSNIDGYESLVVVEDADITDYSIDPLGNLEESGKETVVTETGTLEAARAYRTFPFSVAQRATAETTGEIGNIVVADTISCGGDDCGDLPSDGCQRLFAARQDVTTATLLWSEDGGNTWNEETIAGSDTSGAVPTVVAGGNNIIIAAHSGAGQTTLYRAPIADIVEGTATWTNFFATATGNIADMYARGATIFAAGFNGTAGQVYEINTSGFGVTLVDNGVASPAQPLNAISALDADNAVAVGDGGTLLISQSSGSWAAGAVTVNGAAITTNLTSVVQKTISEWYVAGTDGIVYCTTNRGRTWSQLATLGAAITDMVFVGNNAGYAAAGNNVYRTRNGGSTWAEVKTTTGASVSGTGTINSIAMCQNNVNFLAAAGDAGAAGMIFVGASN